MNILFITYTRIGDAVLSTGLLATLIERYPSARITVACGPLVADLFATAPNVDRVIALRKRKASLHWLGLWRACVARSWDLVVDLRNSAPSYFMRVRRREVLRGGNSNLHRVERLATVLDLDPPPAPRLWTTQRHLDMARDLVPGRQPVLALGPTANWRGKQWDGIRFAELALRLTNDAAILPGVPVVVLGAASERQDAETVLRLIPSERRIDLVGRVDLLTAYAVLRRCNLFIGNDSGLMHIAAAAGTPTLGLFGPSRERHYAPWGDRAAAVRTQLDYDDLVGGPGYDHRTTGSLMGTLSVDDVEEAAIRLWRRCEEEAA